MEETRKGWVEERSVDGFGFSTLGMEGAKHEGVLLGFYAGDGLRMNISLHLWYYSW